MFNNHGVPSEKPAEFAFYLAPHYYETWPFYLLCAGLVPAAGGTAHFSRLRVLRRIGRLERLHALDTWLAGWWTPSANWSGPPIRAITLWKAWPLTSANTRPNPRGG